jgi:hypothetical protein
MIQGVHAMFYSSEPEALRSFIRDQLPFPFTDGISDRGYGSVIHFKMPGDLEVELYQPRYRKTAR